jgi:CDP-diacylglycerol pyrophosphatase
MAVIVAAAGATVAPVNADPNALWTIVHDQCVPDQEANSDPGPCALVELTSGQRRGYAVLKDLVGATQFLLIPTDQISGIESPSSSRMPRTTSPRLGTQAVSSTREPASISRETG